MALASVVFMTVACSTGGSSPISTLAESPATTESAPVPNPWTSLEALALRENAIDHSRLSVDHEGMFAVVLADKRSRGICCVGTFTFWRWDGSSWNEVTKSISSVPDFTLFEPGSSYGAFQVTSYDYNQDGVIDFLVKFDESEMGLNHPLGGILSRRGGSWDWERFVLTDGQIVPLVQSLEHWPDSAVMTMRDFPLPDQMAAEVDVRWDSDREKFVANGMPYLGD